MGKRKLNVSTNKYAGIATTGCGRLEKTGQGGEGGGKGERI
jgi:hypothetical protein